jgi:flagellar basal-body rod modification protein FlgD
MQINNLSSIPADATFSSPGSSSTNAANSSSAANGLANPNLFITLLTAQLKAQDPLNPLSPQDMVNQLTAVSSLQQLVNINQTLKNISTGSTGTSPSQTNPLGS